MKTRRHRHRSSRRRKHRGGTSAAMPLRYVSPSAPLTNALPGGDLLRTFGNTIRNQIGGAFRKQRHQRRTRKGGFIPSVMEGFVAATSKYITPMALFAAYKLVNRPTKKKGRRTRK